MCSRNKSPPTMYGCKRVTSAMRSFLGCSGRTIFRRRGVHMFLVIVHLLLFHSRFLIFVEQFLMPMNAKGDRVATHVHNALGWTYGGVSRSAFHPTMRPSLWCSSKRNRKSEGGPPCNSMPFPCSVGHTILYKVRYFASVASFV